MAHSRVIEINYDPIEEYADLSDLVYVRDFPRDTGVDYVYKVDEDREKSLDLIKEVLPWIERDASGDYFVITEGYKQGISKILRSNAGAAATLLKEILGNANDPNWEAVGHNVTCLLNYDPIWLFKDGHLRPLSHLLHYPEGTKIYIGGMLGYHY